MKTFFATSTAVCLAVLIMAVVPTTDAKLTSARGEGLSEERELRKLKTKSTKMSYGEAYSESESGSKSKKTKKSAESDNVPVRKLKTKSTKMSYGESYSESGPKSSKKTKKSAEGENGNGAKRRF
jgi:hypothetical protein